MHQSDVFIVRLASIGRRAHLRISNCRSDDPRQISTVAHNWMLILVLRELACDERAFVLQVELTNCEFVLRGTMLRSFGFN